MPQSRFRTAIASVLRIARDLLQQPISATARSHAELAAENLFLRKQLALYVERQVKPRRADDATRITLVALSWLIDWRRLLTVVKPNTLMRWHRKGFRLFWRWKSTASGTPSMCRSICSSSLRTDGRGESNLGRGTDCRRTAVEARDSGVAANRAALHARRSPRLRDGTRSQLWSTFVRNHASAVLACDFFVAITATFRVLYVFVVLEVGTRRILHWNVTEHPTAEWTAQQFRMVVAGDTTASIFHS